MKKAVEKVNKHNFNGRPLKVKEVGHTDESYKAAQVWTCASHFCLDIRTLTA